MRRYRLLLVPAVILTLISGYLLINILYERHRISEIYKWERLRYVRDEAERKLIEWRDIKGKSFWEKCNDVCYEERNCGAYAPAPKVEAPEPAPPDPKEGISLEETRKTTEKIQKKMHFETISPKEYERLRKQREKYLSTINIPSVSSSEIKQQEREFQKCKKACKNYCTDIDTKTYIYTALFLIFSVFTLALIYQLKKTKPS